MKQTNEDEEIDRRLAEYRAKHFEFEIGPSKYLKDGVSLSFTTNGHQWDSVGWTKEEARRICDALKHYLDG